jgi:hypothetical protein
MYKNGKNRSRLIWGVQKMIVSDVFHLHTFAILKVQSKCVKQELIFAKFTGVLCSNRKPNNSSRSSKGQGKQKHYGMAATPSTITCLVSFICIHSHRIKSLRAA